MARKLADILKRQKGVAKTASSELKYSAASGARFALFLGDEGAVLIYMKGATVLSRQFAPNADEANLRVFQDVLLQDKRAPIYFIIDTMDQVFVQQTLPPVSSLSVGKLIKRRLDRDFGANDIKGALKLGRDDAGRKDWNFLMVSVERTPYISSWLEFVAELPNRLAGIYLFSIESERIIRYLERGFNTQQDDGGSRWKLLVSHNKVGGFRQVILRDGRIIFTRMTQPIGDPTPEVIAGNIEQEVASTIEYIKRLGYSPQAGLDMYVIAADAVRSVLDLRKLGARVTQVVTPHETAQALNIQGATQPGDQYGDVAMAACIAAARKRVLTFSIPHFEKLASLYQSLIMLRTISVLAFAGMMLYALLQCYEIYSLHQESEDLSGRRVQEEALLNNLKAEVAGSALNIDRMSDMISLYKDLVDQMHSPVPFLAQMKNLSVMPFTIKDVEWKLSEAPKTKAPRTAAAIRAARKSGALAAKKDAKNSQAMTAIVTVDFHYNAQEPELLKLQADSVINALRESYPDYEINYDKPVVAAGGGSIEISFEDPKDKKAGEKVVLEKTLTAKLIITGSVINEIPVPASASADEKTSAAESKGESHEGK